MQWYHYLMIVAYAVGVVAYGIPWTGRMMEAETNPGPSALTWMLTCLLSPLLWPFYGFTELAAWLLKHLYKGLCRSARWYAGRIRRLYEEGR